MQRQSLPFHRQLFTALINAIVQPELLPTSTHSGDATTNPLSGLEPSNKRHLLLTLHVVFPNLLLPALDLLDRGLVTRMTLSGQLEGKIRHHGTEREEKMNIGGEYNEAMCGGPIRVYIVQSVASTMSHRKREVIHSPKRYLIHIDAWSCSCASFALDAYPGCGEHIPDESQEGFMAHLDFGGLSLDGKLDSWDNIPCCKHLLACFLVEKWENVLGRYAEARQTTQNELAALVVSL